MNKPYILTTAVALALGATLAQAQPDAPPAGNPPANPWTSSAALGFTLTRGNSETMLLTGSIQSGRKWDNNEVALGANGTYGEDDVDVNAASAQAFGQYNRLFTERFFGYARADVLHDAIADVKYRITLSPGVGYYFIKNARTSLNGEVGPGYVFEKIGNETDDYLTLRVAEKFEQKIGAGVRLWQTLEYLPEVADFSNYVVNAELGIETSISKSLSLRSYVQDTYRSQPAEGRDRNDLKLVTAIAYKF